VIGLPQVCEGGAVPSSEAAVGGVIGDRQGLCDAPQSAAVPFQSCAAQSRDRYNER